MGQETNMGLAEDVRTASYRSPVATSRYPNRFVAEQSEAERFWAKVEIGPDAWLWLGPVNRWGYGRFCDRYGVMVLAHRFAYEQLRGPIPAGLTLDHLCETPACVWPSHLEPVTNAENVRRRHARKRARENGATTS